MTNNKEATRFYSQAHEKQVAAVINGTVNSNSGAGLFNKGDVVNKDASILVECKTTETPKKSFSIKKEWIDKNKEEAFTTRLDNSCIAFNFEPNGKSYFIINESLMAFLIEKLEEQNN